MQHFPIFLDLTGRRTLVVGDGEAAERKAEALRQAGALVESAPRFTPELLDGCALAIGAEAPEADLAALSQAAQARGIPVNIVDRPALCSYITPSVIDRAPITIAVSSGGAAPVLARLLRAKIEAVVAPAYGRLAALAERFKTEIRAAWPDMAQRRRMLEQALGGHVADLVLAGREAEAEAEMQRLVAGAPQPGGVVYLAGAGPGAADLLTLRTQRLLGEADVIVHDRLVSSEVLDMARRDAARIDVGKRQGQHSMPQAEIGALLVRLAAEGRKVVRLKGGDPTIFGRLNEEIAALREAGTAHVVVPGVTSALACAAGLGLSLTDRDRAQSVVFATGQTGAADFPALLRCGGTLAVYMGLAALPALRDGLVAAGMELGMPAILVESGGTAGQRHLRGTLDLLVAQAPDWTQGGPVMLLLGPALEGLA